MLDKELKGAGYSSLIPDFFHDVIAYFVPGFTVMGLLYLDYIVAKQNYSLDQIDIGIVGFVFISIFAYVIGRFFEQVGLYSIHNRKFPFICISKHAGPKWNLVFEENHNPYTNVFRENLEVKIQEWLKDQEGEQLVKECKGSNIKDDYFNLIQFYLRERFPSIAQYEKKQNATIVLTRSLAIAFFLNVFLYWLVLIAISNKFQFNLIAFYWLMANFWFGFVLYFRFKLDQKYHAMYIFEAFIATKKLLKKSNQIEEKTINLKFPE